ncbi:MAG: HU family DNA-binding protein [Gammaproteobacteria bacterium]|nr:HU family DNA-binding protein [Gammaproteobacteria bacterium]
MNKSDLIEAVAETTDMSKIAAGRAVDALIDAIAKALKAGDTVAIAGFGSFSAKLREARVGRNPKTGEAINIAASRVPAFKSGKGLKDLLK